MHVCESAFRRRNSFLHEIDEADEANRTIEANEASKINRQSR